MPKVCAQSNFQPLNLRHEKNHSLQHVTKVKLLVNTRHSIKRHLRGGKKTGTRYPHKESKTATGALHREITNMIFLNDTNSSLEESILNSSAISSVFDPKRLPRAKVNPSAAELKSLATVNSIASVVGIIGNVLVCFVVMKFRFLGRPKSELFIASLAVADLLVCVMAQPMYVLFLYGLLPAHLDVIRKAITWISTLVSVSHLFAISIERFLSLYFLHRFSFFIPDNIIWSSIVLTWLIAIGFGAPAATIRKARIVSQYFVIAMFLGFPALYAGTFYIVRLQQKRFKQQFPAKPLFTSQRSFTSERKIVHMIAIVVGVFYLCFTPLIVLPFLFSIRVLPSVRVNALRAFPWVNTLAFCNSCVNPYIYYWRSWRFRLALELIFRRVFENK